MLAYVGRRFAAMLASLLMLVVLTFGLIRLAPGGPLDGERDVPADVRAAIEARYHLDESLPRQFVRFLGHLIQGDLGPSFRYPDYTVNELIAQGFPVSAKLGAMALLLACAFGCGIGLLAAARQGSAVDGVLMFVAACGISLPSFVVGPILILVFSLTLNWLPAGGWVSGEWQDWLLPVFALALPHLAVVARLVRGSAVEVLASDYIRTARAKGVSQSRKLLVHALRPSLLPVVSYLTPATVAVLTGSVVIEVIFGIPGMGRYLVQGALNRDYTLVMGVVIVVGGLMFLVSLVADLIYAWVDPRIRMEKTL